MFEDIMKSIQFLSPSQASGLSDFGGLLKSIGNPEQYQKQQQGLLMGENAKAAQVEAEAKKGQIQKQKAIEELLGGMLLPQQNQIPVGGNSALGGLPQSNNSFDVGGFLRKAASIDPSYANELIKYEASQKPDWKMQEVDGALVRYNANDPTSKPELVYGNSGGKPLSDIGKLAADLNAGRIDKDTYDRKVAKEVAPTEKNYKQFQLQNAAYADMMVQANDKMMPYEAKIATGEFDPVNNVSAGLAAIPSFGAGSALGNTWLSADQQKYKQSQEQWVRAKLRKESGAAIGIKEMEDEIKTFFPRVGDKLEVIKQKAAMRDEATRSMQKQTGGAYDDMYSTTPTQEVNKPSAPQYPEGKTATGANGEKIIFRGGKWTKL